MTIEEIEAMDCNVLTVKTVAEFLGKDPQVIRDQAEREPKYLGFPICKAGHSYSIPRVGFITWVTGKTPISVAERCDQISEIEIRDGAKRKGLYTPVYEMDIVQFEQWAESNNLEIAKTASEKNAYVYFVSDGEYVKIGVATNLNRRLQELQISQPRPLKIIMAIPFRNNESAYYAETLFHNAFARYAIRGEWFKALEIVTKCNLRNIFAVKILKGR